MQFFFFFDIVLDKVAFSKTIEISQKTGESKKLDYVTWFMHHACLVADRLFILLPPSSFITRVLSARSALQVSLEHQPKTMPYQFSICFESFFRTQRKQNSIFVHVVDHFLFTHGWVSCKNFLFCSFFLFDFGLLGI